ncbi:DUF3265 domain-containing protein [Vibrio vulnificus]|nr:DUF3265 domain-containing protein [Vibrio vulnificus]
MECDSKLTHYHPNWLNFNSDNYPARGGRRLSGIHAAWHFWYAVNFGGGSCLRKVGLCGIHPLTQRYV